MIGTDSVAQPVRIEAPRLAAIEGVRAYLACWVVVCHAMWASGYELGALSGLARLMRDGGLAVDVFILLSGFVIFLLLDTKRPTFGPFIVRRFFRLIPLFIALFILSIPISRLSLWNLTHAAPFLNAEHLADQALRIEAWWQNLYWHVPLHLVMLQGAVPEFVLNDSPGAFLDAAWSVSLEWQFYLVAPLAFTLAVNTRPFRRIALCVGCALLYLAAGHLLPAVRYGAALPFHLDYFFIGAVSYFAYKRFAGRFPADTTFPIACCLALFLFGMTGEARFRLIPLALWVALLGLLLEDRSSWSWRWISSLFTHRIPQLLGRISYSIYLSHMLVLVVVQYALFTWAPDLGRTAHLGALLVLTMTATIGTSVFLYRWLEVPGIWAGRELSDRLARRGRPEGARPAPPGELVQS